MGTTVLRFAKIKNMANIRQAGAHQHRHHLETPNANPKHSKLNRYFHGSSNLAADVDARLAVLDKAPRKNAVLAVEGLLTLSPELFKDEGGKNDLAALNAWYTHSKDWLKDQFGDNLVNAVLHRDEQTPHIHFTVVPIVERDGGKYALSARDMFTKESLHNFQKSYYAALDGNIQRLEPPKHGSKRSHTEISHFYEILDQVKDQLKEAGQQMLQELLNECSDTIKGKYMPLVDQAIERTEKALEGRLAEDIKAKMRDAYQNELEAAIGQSFKAPAPTLDGLAKRLTNAVEQAKLQVGGEGLTPDQSISFVRPKRKGP